jgi:hypothetical protein
MASVSINVSRTFGDLAQYITVPADDMREIGLLLRERITRRTIGGKDVNGAAFQPYSAAYAVQKGSTHVDLTVSGNMLNHLQVVSAEDNKVTLGWVQ